jgi:hypothetical protein
MVLKEESLQGTAAFKRHGTLLTLFSLTAEKRGARVTAMLAENRAHRMGKWANLQLWRPGGRGEEEKIVGAGRGHSHAREPGIGRRRTECRKTPPYTPSS